MRFVVVVHNPGEENSYTLVREQASSWKEFKKERRFDWLGKTCAVFTDAEWRKAKQRAEQARKDSSYFHRWLRFMRKKEPNYLKEAEGNDTTV